MDRLAEPSAKLVANGHRDRGAARVDQAEAVEIRRAGGLVAHESGEDRDRADREGGSVLPDRFEHDLAVKAVTEDQRTAGGESCQYLADDPRDVEKRRH